MAGGEGLAGDFPGVVLRREGELQHRVRRRRVGSIQGDYGHGQPRLREHLADGCFGQRPDDQLRAAGNGGAVRRDRAVVACRVVDGEGRACAVAGEVRGEEAVAHRRGGGGQAAAEGQQQGHALRRAIDGGRQGEGGRRVRRVATAPVGAVAFAAGDLQPVQPAAERGGGVAAGGRERRVVEVVQVAPEVAGEGVSRRVPRRVEGEGPVREAGAGEVVAAQASLAPLQGEALALQIPGGLAPGARGEGVREAGEVAAQVGFPRLGQGRVGPELRRGLASVGGPGQGEAGSQPVTTIERGHGGGKEIGEGAAVAGGQGRGRAVAAKVRDRRAAVRGRRAGLGATGRQCQAAGEGETSGNRGYSGHHAMLCSAGRGRIRCLLHRCRGRRRDPGTS